MALEKELSSKETHISRLEDILVHCLRSLDRALTIELFIQLEMKESSEFGKFLIVKMLIFLVLNRIITIFALEC